MADKYAGYSSGVSDPARKCVAVVPVDGVDLIDVPTSLYVGVAGDIVMIGVDAPTGAAGVTWKNVPAGSILPFRPRRILATGTTAGSILALY